MIPTGGVSNISLESVTEPSRTWKIDFNKNKMSGVADGLEAVKQAVFLVLNTERYEHVIFSFDYAIELQNLIGGNAAYVNSELNRRINEALTQDDRIESIQNFSAEISGDSISVTFTVISKYGSFAVIQEVS